MHLIPQSWSHLHILVSVFPSVGFIFVMGVFYAGLRTNNKIMQLSGLTALGIIGLLAIPTYFSGTGSEAALVADAAANMRLDQAAMSSHYTLGLIALAGLLITGALAWVEVFRFRGTGVLNRGSLNLVLGVGVVSLLIVIVAAFIGWNINHPELRLDPETVRRTLNLDPETPLTPQTWTHFHMILNHFPTVGFVFTLGFFIVALMMDNETFKRVGLVLFTICAILAVPTYVTGAAAMWAMREEVQGISAAAINAHRDMALWTLFGCAFTGVLSWIELWRYRYLARFSSRSLYLVLTFAIITLGIMAETGHRGGQINHPEIRTEALPTDAAAYLSPQIENLINNVEWFVPWQTVHFFGYSLVFGTVLAVTLRIFGFWKAVPFSAVHRLLPLGVFGVTMNVFTGMLMLMADTFRYVNEVTFIPKMFFLPIGALAVLYLSLSERLWKVRANEDAPGSAKAVAALVLISWTIVIMGGRLLPYV